MSDPVNPISTLLSFTDMYEVSISDYLLILLLSIGTLLFVYKTTRGR